MPSTTFYNLPEEKRERLLAAARAEFARTSYAEASVNRIIQAAGIPRGSFYMYFADKEELFRYLMERYGDMLVERFASLLDREGGDLFAAFLDLYDEIASRLGVPAFAAGNIISCARAYTTEELEQADRDRWAELDWTDAASYTDYMGNTQNALAGFGLGGTYSTSTETTGYDPETHTITYLLSVTASTPGLDFTTQPLTLLVAPPVMEASDQLTAVTDHPALLTFRPEAVSQTLTGSWREDGRVIRVTVSPFSITVELSGGTPYRQLGELKQDTSLVLRDGSLQPVAELTLDLSGVGGRGGEGSSFTDASFTSQFRELLDVSQVTAVQVGDTVVPVQ